MALPDVSRFEVLAAAQWAAFAQRLRAVSLERDAVAPITRICEGMLDPLRATMRRYHLRRRSDVLALAMRLFMFGDGVTAAEAEQVVGPELLGPLRDAGMIVAATNGELECPFSLNLLGPLLIFTDDLTEGSDAVMGAANTTADLCAAAAPKAEIGSVLDLGCGAGTVGLFLGAHARRVVATDVNPRAIALARANAALNSITNVEFRLGDLFEPVAGEEFDLIVSQPPFVARPEGVPDATYLYGGRRGDELALRLLGEIPRYIAPGGRAVLLVDWPVVDDEPLQGRVRAAVADPSLSVLLLVAPAQDLDEWSSAHAAIEEKSLDERFERRAVQRRAHFDRLGIRELRLTFTVLVRSSADPGWTRALDVLPFSRAFVNGSHVDRLIASTELYRAPPEQLLDARLRLPHGAEIVERAGKLRVGFPDLLAPIELSRGAGVLTAAVNEEPSVRAALDAAMEKLKVSPSLRDQVLEGVRQGLWSGVLELDD